MEDLFARQMPHSIQAEQAVLGSALIDSRCVKDIIGIVAPEDFYIQQNRDIFSAIFSMFNFSETIDPVTVLEKLQQTGKADDNTVRYLGELMETTPTAANVKQYAKIVRDKALLRRLSETATDINEQVYSGVGTVGELLEAAEKKIFALRRDESTEALERIGPILQRYYETLVALFKSDSDIPGHSTGLRDLDQKIKGLNKSDLIILAARPGMGKTALALSFATQVAEKTGKAVAFFSLEMSREQLAMRVISTKSCVPGDTLITGKLHDDDWEKVSLAISALSKTDIRVNDNPMITVTEMNAECRRVENLGLVVIDYLQLMSSASGRENENRVQAVSEISRSLKILAKELNVPVVCLSQLSRNSEKREDKRPMMSDLRESGSIEQDADQILFLYRDDYYNENSEEKNIVEIIVAKNRHGEPGKVKVQWSPAFYAYSDLDWKHENG